MNRRSVGSDGEYTVRDYLRELGYRILEMNYRRPTGEIDLIARDGDVTVFIEVKRRASLRRGRPAEAVNRGKQRHIIRTALVYLQEQKSDDVPMRFDVIELTPGRISHIQNAFDATGMF